MSKQAIEMALEALERFVPMGSFKEGGLWFSGTADVASQVYDDESQALDAIEALKEAIKQQGEPVAQVDDSREGCIDWFGSIPEQGVALYTAAPSIPEGWQLVRIEVVEFLRGAGPLDGLWFGDSDTEKPRARYWWRKYLGAAPSYKGEQQ